MLHDMAPGSCDRLRGRARWRPAWAPTRTAPRSAGASLDRRLIAPRRSLTSTSAVFNSTISNVRVSSCHATQSTTPPLAIHRVGRLGDRGPRRQRLEELARSVVHRACRRLSSRSNRRPGSARTGRPLRQARAYLERVRRVDQAGLDPPRLGPEMPASAAARRSVQPLCRRISRRTRPARATSIARSIATAAYLPLTGTRIVRVDDRRTHHARR